MRTKVQVEWSSLDGKEMTSLQIGREDRMGRGNGFLGLKGK